jgi:ABC-type transporter Mla MlaB component
VVSWEGNDDSFEFEDCAVKRSRPPRGVSEPAIAITGPMTLAECEAGRTALLAAMVSGGDVRLDLSGSGPWDLAGLQVVLSAVKTARAAGRSLTLLRAPEGFSQVAEKAASIEFLAPSMARENS